MNLGKHKQIWRRSKEEIEQMLVQKMAGEELEQERKVEVLKLGILWIATAWLATGLFMAPAVSGHEPKFQRFGVNFLFVCLLIIVAGSMIGKRFAVQQKLGNVTNFWFGHQIPDRTCVSGKSVLLKSSNQPRKAKAACLSKVGCFCLSHFKPKPDLT